jgi:hypothetical protein
VSAPARFADGMVAAGMTLSRDQSFFILEASAGESVP